MNALSTHALPQFWDIFEIVSDVVNKFYSKHSRKPNGREMTDIILKVLTTLRDKKIPFNDKKHVEKLLKEYSNIESR